MVEYKEFDKNETPREIHNKILDLLEKQPLERKDLHKYINATYTKIDLQLNKLIKDKSVDKQYFSGVWFYGLTKRYRNELKNNVDTNANYKKAKGMK